MLVYNENHREETIKDKPEAKKGFKHSSLLLSKIPFYTRPFAHRIIPDNFFPKKLSHQFGIFKSFFINRTTLTKHLWRHFKKFFAFASYDYACFSHLLPPFLFLLQILPLSLLLPQALFAFCKPHSLLFV